MSEILLALFWPPFGPSSEFMSTDGDQCVLIFQGHLGKTALGLSGSMPSHGRGRRFKSSPAYHAKFSGNRVLCLTGDTLIFVLNTLGVQIVTVKNLSALGAILFTAPIKNPYRVSHVIRR